MYNHSNSNKAPSPLVYNIKKHTEHAEGNSNKCNLMYIVYNTQRVVKNLFHIYLTKYWIIIQNK